MKDKWVDFIIHRLQGNRDQPFLLKEKIDSVVFCKQTKGGEKFILVRLDNKKTRQLITIRMDMDMELISGILEEEIPPEVLEEVEAHKKKTEEELEKEEEAPNAVD